MSGSRRTESGSGTRTSSLPPGSAPETHPAEAPWHAQTVAETLEKLRTSSDGLSDAEANERRAVFGANLLQARRSTSAARILVRQFTDFMVLVLLAAAFLSALLGEHTDAFAILLIVALNGLLGFVQELRAERALAALADMAAPSADVQRNRVRTTVPATDLVPGDVLHLEAGTITPADVRLIEAHGLRIDEAPLTGESEPVDKQLAPIGDAETALGDRTNLAYAGTLVTYGRGVGVVVGTGHGTEFGKIADLLRTTMDTETPLARRLRGFGIRLSVGILALCAALFGLGLLRGEPTLPMFLTAVSLAVAAIPEALPAVVTVNLALGARKMAAKNAVIRRLSAVESLGSVTFICSDKTGTLTRNRMRAERFWIDGTATDTPPSNDLGADFLRVMTLCNDAVPDASGTLVGDPTETALMEAAEEHGTSQSEAQESWPRIGEAPFDSSRMRMSTLHPEADGTFLLATKGAVESIVKHASSVRTSSDRPKLPPQQALQEADAMARDGLRVLAIAQRRLSERPDDEAVAGEEHDLELLGLVGLLDPPRDEARAAVEQCQSAGITPVMITGDHPTTATAIARRLGILSESESATAGAPPDIETRAYARVTPERKLEIVRHLQEKGEIVAMTGDGVNDAPALRQADVGVAMGITGTDVAKEASEIVLLDDDFATLVSAVREGRRIYDNVRRFIRYALATNVGEVLTVASAPLLGLPLPLLPVQILFINLLTDGLPGIALAAEPAERGVMTREPHPPEEGLLARGLGLHACWVGALIAAISLTIHALTLDRGVQHAQTLVFLTLGSAQLWHVMAIRSESDPLWKVGPLTNLPLLAAVIGTMGVLVASVTWAPLRGVLQTAALAPREVALGLCAPAIVFFAAEGEKKLRNRAPTGR